MGRAKISIVTAAFASVVWIGAAVLLYGPEMLVLVEDDDLVTAIIGGAVALNAALLAPVALAIRELFYDVVEQYAATDRMLRALRSAARLLGYVILAGLAFLLFALEWYGVFALLESGAYATATWDEACAIARPAALGTAFASFIAYRIERRFIPVPAEAPPAAAE